MLSAVIENGFAVVAGEVVVFNYDGLTREYLSQSTEYLPVGVSIPANACTDTPLAAKSGYVVCRNSKLTGWEYLVDHRGETVWNVKTGEAQQITVPGDYPADTTIYPPSTPYDKWNGERWVTDEAVKAAADIAEATATKTALIKGAAAKIEPLQDAVELDMATEEEKSRYDAWRKYRVLLTRVDTSLAPDINWPDPPED
ncbi:tail fiber assembly protein [Salmonella enterica]|uniref:tail fiber assembly protein n=1 Tax=Enterobacter kobei TaxID=208224 RepID=UPI0017E44DBC|nr:tail fiber assembly protein [Salmonella enterica]EEW9676961.1 tail fiber assembly protein [Salmonella enterica subsp. enterica]EGH0693280.1 tail fiber assembly protein [Salmonella enterica subsp. enterica serovar Cubana]MCU2406172.1 tail fiber assembly protein [Enterobacter hormaechei subsp. xiangfangensis]EAT2486610.1 tail fiber assembly protein [Salmonella enterica]